MSIRNLVQVLLGAGLILLQQAAHADGLKLLRYGPVGAEKPGVLDSEGRIRDLSQHIEDIDPSTLAMVPNLKGIDIAELPLVEGEPRIGLPVAGTSKIIAIGFNYKAHASEMTTALPKEPLVFMKAVSALHGPYDPVQTPRASRKLDYEAELVIIIGRKAQYVSKASALDYVAGYSVGHDVSEREFQRERGGQFVKGKSADTFAPIGPWLVTPDALADVQKLKIWSKVNGDMRQNASTEDMIFSAATIVSYVSQFMTLEPGDAIFTGTPAGVGAGMTPPTYLKPGDVVEIGIEGLGVQKQIVLPALEAMAEKSPRSINTTGA